MPRIKVEVSSDLLIWAGANALENSRVPKGEYLLSEYYKGEHLSYQRKGINPSIKPPKKPSVKSRVVTKFHSWAHCNFQSIKSSLSPNLATLLSSSLSWSLSLLSTHSNLSSDLLASTDNSPHTGSDISRLSSPCLTYSPSVGGYSRHYCKTFFDSTEFSFLRDTSAAPQTPGDTSAPASETLTTSTPTASLTLVSYQHAPIISMPQPGVPESPWFNGLNVTQCGQWFANRLPTISLNY